MARGLAVAVAILALAGALLGWSARNSSLDARRAAEAREKLRGRVGDLEAQLREHGIEPTTTTTTTAPPPRPASRVATTATVRPQTSPSTTTTVVRPAPAPTASTVAPPPSTTSTTVCFVPVTIRPGGCP